MIITLELSEEELLAMDNPKCLYHFLHYEDYFTRWHDLTPLLKFYQDLEWFEHCKVIKEFKSEY